jgi:DNA-directed RNA polymerase specialized sigma24 family protein
MTINLTKYDKEFLFREFEDYLENKYKGEFRVPVSVFCEKLSPFESVVKYLVENKKTSYSEIGQLLKKDRQVIWTTYKRASKKIQAVFEIKDSDIQIPLKFLVSDQLSIAELVVFYLKDELKLKNSEISRLLKKDNRTIWTLYNRALKKRGGQR